MSFLYFPLSFCNDAADVKERKEEEKKERQREDKKELPSRPRPLHRTCSLFMRSIAPNISKAEIIAVSVLYTLGLMQS